ncbi:MAG TPA: hypothetical protein VI197_16305 [Polyangiaceae bacterium]
MFPEDPKDPELCAEAEELLTHWPVGDKSPAEWEDLAARIDARIEITDVGSTPDYLLEAPLLEEQDLLRRSHPRMKRPSEGSLAALAKASLSDDASRSEAEREALARSLLSLAVKARTETRNTESRNTESRNTETRNTAEPADAALANDAVPHDNSALLAHLVNGPSMQFLAARQPSAAVHAEPSSVVALPAAVEDSAGAPTSSGTASSSTKTGRERGTMWFGIAFGLLGMAAAGVMYIASARQPALPETAAVVPARPAAAPAVDAPEGAELPASAPKPAGPVAARDVLNVEEVPLAEAAATPAPARDRTTGARRGVPGAAAGPAPAAAPEAEPPAAVPPAAGPSEPGMVMADSRGTLPDHPSTGAVQAAVGTVMGAARACVAGQSAASRATLNFGSDGRVQSVVVAGPAQATGAEPCLRSALSGARVQPFARAGYSVTLTVRP